MTVEEAAPDFIVQLGAENAVTRTSGYLSSLAHKGLMPFWLAVRLSMVYCLVKQVIVVAIVGHSALGTGHHHQPIRVYRAYHRADIGVIFGIGLFSEV